MAAYLGKDGDVWFDTTGTTGTTGGTAALDSWTINPVIETVDVTVYGSSFRSRSQTLKDWSVEASGTFDRSNSYQDTLLDQFDSTLPPAMATVKLFATTSRSASYWSGSAALNNASVVSAVADKVTVSFSLQGNGALTWNT